LYDHLGANAAAAQNVIDLTRAFRELQAGGYALSMSSPDAGKEAQPRS
jgi:hypothetical protein